MLKSSSSPIDINPYHLQEVLRILDLHVPGIEVWAFGSRAKWTAKAYSDLDIALITQSPLSLDEEAKLREALDESTLPFKVDFVDWSTITGSFREIVSQDKVVIRRADIARDSNSSWPVRPLEAVLEALIDYRGKTPEKSPSGIPLITAKIVKCGRIEIPNEFISAESYDAWMTRGLPKVGDVVLTTEAPLGEVAQLDSARVALAQRVILLRGKVGTLDNTYLRYLLQTHDMQEQLAARATGTTVLGIKQSELRQISIRIPPLALQRTSARFLAQLDDRIALLRETNATLEAIAQALFKSWFVDFDPVRAKQHGQSPAGMDEATAALFPHDFEESALGLVPREWRATALNEAFEINPSRTLKKGAVGSYLDMASLATSGQCVAAPVLREFGSGTKFRNGDTLLARITPCLENGKTAFVDFLAENEVGWGSTEFIVLRPKAPLPEYLGYLLCRHPPFREHAIHSMSGTSGRQRVQNDVLGRYQLALPDNAITSAFTELVVPIQKAINGNHMRAQTLATLRDILLPRLTSGQLRLPEAEPALETA